MKNILLACLTILLLIGCVQDSAKVRKQKEIYFSVLSDVSRRVLELEINREMEKQHLATPGKAMIYLLDKNIEYLPQVNSMIDKAAAQPGVQLPLNDPFDQAEDRIKTARMIQAMRQAREAIAEIEASQ